MTDIAHADCARCGARRRPSQSKGQFFTRRRPGTSHEVTQWLCEECANEFVRGLAQNPG